MATKEEILCRLRVLFAVDESRSDEPESYTLSQVLDGEYPIGEQDPFVVDISNPQANEQELDPEGRLKAWLTRPNPAFGNECPSAYLDSDNSAKLDYLDGILDSIEYGDFA